MKENRVLHTADRGDIDFRSRYKKSFKKFAVRNES
jgi:hypothetical protein